MLTRTLCAGAVLSAMGAVTSTMAQGPGSLPPVLEGSRLLDTPNELAAAADIRWQADGSLLVGLREDAVHSWKPGTLETGPVATLAGTTYRRAARYGNYSRLGGGPPGGLVFAGDLFGVYRQRGGRIEGLKENLEIVGDLDHHSGWTVAVGLARQAEPSPGPEDLWEPYVAWLFDAEGGTRGLLPTRDGGVALDSCYPVELSIARFVADDLVLVIPGAEPGAFLYGTDGTLRGTVSLDALSASRPDCRPEQKALLYEEEYRTAWLARHRVLDEVAANGEGDVFFFVRHGEDVSSAPLVSRSTNGARAATAQNASARQVAAGRESIGAGEGKATVVALSLDGISGREVEDLLAEAASEGGLVVLNGDRAAQVLAAAKAQTAEVESPSPTSSAAETGVCWDIVHARVEDLHETSTVPCAVRSDLGDARLRVDLSGDRAILLVRGPTRLASGGAARPRPSELFEARLRAGN